MRLADDGPGNDTVSLAERSPTMDPNPIHRQMARRPNLTGPSADETSSRRPHCSAALDLLASSLSACVGQPVKVGEEPGGPQPYVNALAENQLYTVCLNCNTGCGIKAKIENGVVAKIDGNPFSPMTMTPHVPYSTSVFQTAQVDSPLCPKGQAGLVNVYDPYRITRCSSAPASVAKASGCRSPSSRPSARSSTGAPCSGACPARRAGRSPA